MSRNLLVSAAMLVTLGAGPTVSAGARHATIAPARAAASPHRTGPLDLDDEGPFPGFGGASEWINSPELTKAALRGRVVVVDFWAFSCSNCLNALPHVKALEAKFRDSGVVVVGVHTPELPEERDPAGVQAAVQRLGIVYPVAIDGNRLIWFAFQNHYWPAVYIVDAKGRVRYHHFGEGAYDEQEQVVSALVAEAAKHSARGK
jgi:thiol-disulfide isomerase/thioredoxin